MREHPASLKLSQADDAEGDIRDYPLPTLRGPPCATIKVVSSALSRIVQSPKSYRPSALTAFLGTLGYALCGAASVCCVSAYNDEHRPIWFPFAAGFVGIFTLSALFGFLTAYVGAKLLHGHDSLRGSLESTGLAFLPAGAIMFVIAGLLYATGAPEAVQRAIYWAFVGSWILALLLLAAVVISRNAFGLARGIAFVGWLALVVAGTAALSVLGAR